jgi:citrate synthase
VSKTSRWPGARLSHVGPASITVHGLDLAEQVIGHLSLSQFAFLGLTGAVPDAGSARIFDAMLVAIAEHGLTPSALATRLT